jgi:hypothetical protein
MGFVARRALALDGSLENLQGEFSHREREALIGLRQVPQMGLLAWSAPSAVGLQIKSLGAGERAGV